MNSKQYVIFLLCLFLFSVACPKDTGSHMLNIGPNGPIDLVDDYQGPDGIYRFHDQENDHAPEESSDELYRDPEECHDKPEENDSEPDDSQGSDTDEISNDPSPDKPTASPVKYRPLWQSIAISSGITMAGSCIVTGVLLFTLDRIVERAIINEVLAPYGKSIKTISSNDAKLMHMAYCIDDNGLRKLMHQMIKQHGNRIFTAQKRLWVIPAVTHLYFDAEPTDERIAELMALVA